MNKSEFIKEWERSTENLAQYFIARYFGSANEVGNTSDNYWVADAIGGVLYINDYFFNLSDIVDFIKYDYSKDKMFEYYEYTTDCMVGGDIKVNIKNYLKLIK